MELILNDDNGGIYIDNFGDKDALCKELKIEIMYTIKNNESGLYVSTSPSGFTKNIRTARFYKSKKTALANYFNNRGEYDNLSIVAVKVAIVEEEKVSAQDFEEYQYWSRRNGR